jgi:hypothetical protein
MRAQVTTVEASPARLDDPIRSFQEQVLPRLRQMDGFEEFIAQCSTERQAARCGPLGERRSLASHGGRRLRRQRSCECRPQPGCGCRRRNGGKRGALRGLCQRGALRGPLGAVTGTVGGVTDTVGGATDTLLGAERRKASEGRATSTDARRGEGRDR